MRNRNFGNNEELPLGGQHSSVRRHGRSRMEKGTITNVASNPAIDPNRVLDRSENMDRDLRNDPGRLTERERRDGRRPEDLETEREEERGHRRAEEDRLPTDDSGEGAPGKEPDPIL